MKFTKHGECECGGRVVFRPTANSVVLGQWVHIDGARKCRDGSLARAKMGTVKKNVEDVQVTRGRL